jgi:hypothetical protein
MGWRCCSRVGFRRNGCWGSPHSASLQVLIGRLGCRECPHPPLVPGHRGCCTRCFGAEAVSGRASGVVQIRRARWDIGSDSFTA